MSIPFRSRRKIGARLSHSTDPCNPSLERLEDRMVPAVIHPVAQGVVHKMTTHVVKHDTMTTTGSSGSSESFNAVFNATPTTAAGTASVSQFNPNLGVLTSVDIIGSGELQTHVQMENLGPAADTFQTTVGGTLSFLAPGTPALSSSPSQVFSGSMAAFDGVPDLSGPSSKDFGTATLSGTFNEVQITQTSQLAAYIGTGNVQVSENATAQSTTVGSGNLLAMITTMAEGNVQIIYNYAPAATIAGNVYYDIHKQGFLQAGDPPIASVLLTLTGTDIYGNIINRTTRTAANGTYSFTGLMPGTYMVSETQPYGYLQGTNTVGSLGGQIQGDHIESISVSAGDNGTQYNFGEIRNPSTPPTPPPSPPTPPVVPSKFFLFGSTLDYYGW